MVVRKWLCTALVVALVVASGQNRSGVLSADETPLWSSQVGLSPAMLGRAGDDRDLEGGEGSGVPEKAAEPSVWDFLSTLEMSGYVDVAYTYNFNSSSTDPSRNPAMQGGETPENPGRIFDRFHNQVIVHNARIRIEKPATEESLVGFAFSPTFGVDGEVTSAGENNLVDTDGLDVLEAYVSIYVPEDITLLGDITFKLGKFVTPIGAESIDAPYNDMFSRTYLFGLATPFTHTGILATRKYLPRADGEDVFTVSAGIVNGWDVVKNNNDALSFLGSVTMEPNDLFSLAVNGIAGPEQDNDTKNWTSLIDTVLKFKIPKRDLSFTINFDYGETRRLDEAHFASWYGFAGTMRYDFPIFIPEHNDWFVAIRGEMFDDLDGSRQNFGVASPTEGDGVQVWDIAAALGYEPIPALLLRTELRYDRSDRKVFDNASKHQQTTLAFETAIKF